MLDLLVAGLDGFRAGIATPTLASVADRYLEVLGSRAGRPRLESPAVENYLRRAKTAAAYRLGRRLDAAAISRAHDVFYWSVAWTRARWLGAQALKNPLDLWVYQEILFETRPSWSSRQARTEAAAPSSSRPCATSWGRRRSSLARHRASARRLPGASAHHVPRRPLVDRPRGARGRPLARRRTPDARRPRPDHSQAHVEAEPEAYAPIVPVGGYVIVEDSNIGQIRSDLMPGPLQAIETFLDGNDEFEIDREREKFLITFNPSGYLRRARQPLLGGAVGGPHVRSRPRPVRTAPPVSQRTRPAAVPVPTPPRARSPAVKT